jgi:SulP family sulfate permease
MKKMSDISEVKSSVGSVDDFAHEVAWIDETALSDDLLHKVYIKHFDGPIFFGFASRFQQMTQALPEVEVVIMRMKKVPYIDQSGMYAIEDALMALRGKNILVLMTEIQEQPKDMLKRIGIVPNWISEQHLYSDFSSCIEDLKSGEVFTDVQGKDDYLWDYIAR